MLRQIRPGHTAGPSISNVHFNIILPLRSSPSDGIMCGIKKMPSCGLFGGGMFGIRLA
jgi:hypothetical protein